MDKKAASELEKNADNMIEIIINIISSVIY